MWNTKILLLILSATVVEPRPPRALLGEPFPPVPAPFNFNYEVSDAETGDTKSHHETLEDGVLKGTYTVVQPDGLLRVINYISDEEHGFRADVKYEEGYAHIIPKAVEESVVQEVIVLPVQEEVDPPALVPYNFGYEVNDAETGDTKTHQETLEDGVLRGSYSVVQPDGVRRIVNYVSDAENGFRADVTYEKVQGYVIPINVKQQTSPNTKISLDTTDSQIFCANCNGESFESANVISENNIDNSPSVDLELINTGFNPPLVQVFDFSDKNVALANQDEPAPAPQPPMPYNFGYKVSDVETGDTKSHQETMEDGILRGSYSVVQPDGVRRVVNYVSDAENGFRADVTYENGYENIIPKIVEEKHLRNKL